MSCLAVVTTLGIHYDIFISYRIIRCASTQQYVEATRVFDNNHAQQAVRRVADT